MPSLAELHRLGRPASGVDRLMQRVGWPLRNAWMALRRRARLARLRLAPGQGSRPLRLHVGCGSHRIDGWLNLDLDPLPGVDVAVDVRRGLPYGNGEAEAVFAEHFLEHLPVDAAMGFLLEAHRVLRAGGVLRLSTPNLEWVLATGSDGAGGVDAVAVNRAFHGWGHRFLWDRPLLREALEACGFAELEWPAYRESRRPGLAGLEGHETYGDSPELGHVLVVEAVRAEPRPERLPRLLERLQRDLLHHVEAGYSPSYWREAWWRERRGR